MERGSLDRRIVDMRRAMTVSELPFAIPRIVVFVAPIARRASSRAARRRLDDLVHGRRKREDARKAAGAGGGPRLPQPKRGTCLARHAEIAARQCRRASDRLSVSRRVTWLSRYDDIGLRKKSFRSASDPRERRGPSLYG